MKKIMSLLMIVSLSSMTLSYASFDSPSSLLIETVLIGEWSQSFLWSADLTYAQYETVIYNGLTYVSLKNNNTKIPGATGSQNWWSLV